MRFEALRWFVAVAAALLALSSIAATSLRACDVGHSGVVHGAGATCGDSEDSAAAAAADGAMVCFTQCVESARSAERTAPADTTVPILAPPFTAVRTFVPAQPANLFVASSELIVGPPLTILFRHLRR